MPPAEDEADPVELMRLGPAQTLLLDLFALTQQPPAPDDVPDLHGTLARQIGRWHRKLRADAKRFQELDDVALHTLRKRAKSLRYAVEFGAGLFKRRAVERYLKPLRALQECLGEIVDVMVALDAFRTRSGGDPHALFALGWLAARKQELLERSDKPVRAFLKADAFWKSRVGYPATASAAGQVRLEVVRPQLILEPRPVDQVARLLVQVAQHEPHALPRERALQLPQRVQARGVHQHQPVHLEHHGARARRQRLADRLDLGDRAEEQRAVQPQHLHAGGASDASGSTRNSVLMR